MSKQWTMVIDLQRCVGCDGCTVACKQEHDLPVGMTWNPVLTAGPIGTFPELSACYVHKPCMHCTDAPCVDACPTGAMIKRADGIVYVEKSDCNGCTLCVDACPYDSVTMNTATGLAEKCTFCVHRVEKGLQPACVVSCVGKAMFFGDASDPSDRVHHLLKEQAGRSFHLWQELKTGPSVVYLKARNFKSDIPRDILRQRSSDREMRPVEWMPRAWPRQEEADKVVRTACLDCHSRCGALVHVNDGIVVKVEGNPEHPLSRGIMCAKGSAVRQILYHPDRVNHPLRRTRPKGDADPGWEKISWDEALDTISQKLLAYKSEFGAESVCFGFGTGRETNQYSFRITNTFGTPNRTGVTNLCTGPQTAAARAVWGGGLHGIEPDFANTECIVLWGYNPSHSVPGHAQHILDAQEKGARLIVVDPVFTPLASKADLWLPVRPGTDGAMALAWMNVIVQEGLCDQSYITRWSNGPFLVRGDNGNLLTEAEVTPGGDAQKHMVWDETTRAAVPHDTPGIQPALNGSFEVKGIPCRTGWEHFTDRLSDYSPEAVSEITWVPAEQIREAARAYATAKPAALGMHLGVSQHTNGFQNNLALNQLIGLCGNLDAVGGNVDWNVGISRWFAMGWPALDKLPAGQAEKRLGSQEAPLLSGGVFACAHYTKVWEAILTGKPYPVKGIVLVATNPVVSVENSREAREALEKLEFLVVMDYFMTPTGELADIVLPAAHWTERDNLSEEVCKNFITARPHAIEPLFERWPDEKFYNELAKRLGMADLWWKDVEEILNWELEDFGITWEEMKEKYILEVPKKYRSYEDTGFRTPTKRVELYSSTLGKLGFDVLPYYEEPYYSPVSQPAMAQDYPLVLTASGRVAGYYHSAYRVIPWLRELAPDPQMSIHPKTAGTLGIGEGDWVWIETTMGRIKQKAHLNGGISPRVVQVNHGWWQGCKELGEDGYGWGGANVNVLIDNKHNDPYVGAPAMRATLCRVYKA